MYVLHKYQIGTYDEKIYMATKIKRDNNLPPSPRRTYLTPHMQTILDPYTLPGMHVM